MTVLLQGAIGAAFLAVIVYFYTTIRYNRKYNLPPLVEGGIPLLGNALQLPPVGHEAGMIVKQWAEKYGEMYPPPSLPLSVLYVNDRYTVKLGGYKWVFLNSSRTVNDLLEKRAAIYCSRPPFPMTQDIVSGGGRMVLMPYGDTWRRLRKIMHQILSTRQASTYKNYQDLESKQLLWDYLHIPNKWYLHNGRFSNSGMFQPLLWLWC
jgi:hypothetical protein